MIQEQNLQSECHDSVKMGRLIKFSKSGVGVGVVKVKVIALPEPIRIS